MFVELSTNLAGLNFRCHPLRFDVLDVVGDPIDQLVAVPLEVLGSHQATVPRGATPRLVGFVAGVHTAS